MKLHQVWKIAGSGIAALCFLLSGCGGKGNSANVITVAISSSSGQQLILGQSTTLTATVSGTDNHDVNWTPVCQWTKTITDSNGKVTTSKAADCPSDPSVNPPDPNHTLFGVFSNQQATGTEVFTATSNLPDPKTYPGLLIIVTAQSQQNTSKTGTISLSLNSGIGISFTPTTASLPTDETQAFTALLTNDIGTTTGVTWSLTQNVPDSKFGSTPNPYTPLPTCSVSGDATGCGSITPDAVIPNVAHYHAPKVVPTAITPAQTNNTSSPANVTVVAVSKGDPTRVAIGIITITPSGPITFNGITPTIAPQGATLWDIYLDAPNLSSASTIYLTDSSGGTTHITSDSGQVKILFPIPSSSSSTSTTTPTTCSSTTPCSTGARLRLNSLNLTTPGPITVSVSDPAQPCNTTNPPGTPCTASGISTFNIVPVRPTSTATMPDDIVQGSQTQPFQVTLDGGYFGSFAPNPSAPGQTNLTSVYFQSLGNKTLSVDPSSSSSKLVTSLDPSIINPGNPGLYPLYVKSNAPAQPSPNNPSVTNMALFPDYSAKAPAVVSASPGIPAGTNPSAVDVDESLGVMVVAEAGAPASGTTPAVPSGIQFYKIGQGTLAPIDQNGAPCTTACPITSQTFPGVAISTPTGISVNRTNHTLAIVNYGTQSITTSGANGSCTQSSSTGQSVTVLPIPGAPPPTSGTTPTPFTVPLPYDPAAGSGQALQGTAVCPAPMPYSIGVDPDSNLALVAYSSSPAAPTSAVNLGFIVNLNPNSGTNNYKCLLTDALTGQDPTSSSAPVGQCLFAQVTLNTGTYPQVAVTPHGHSALVTPGGSGFVREVDVTKPSTANFITSASLSGGVVTVVVSTQCPPGVSPTSSDTKNPCPLTMLPGSAGSVLITGLTANTASANTAFFNGVFTVNVTSSNSFTYGVPNLTATDSCKAAANTNPPVCQGEVFYGKPDQIFTIPATSQGIAINPITNTAAIADTNATGLSGSQVNLLSGLDQSPSSIHFFPNCTAFTTTCSASSPEFLPTADVAWQPFTNSLVSYNPHLNQVSLSDPVTQKRYAFACASSSACQVNPVIPAQIQLSGTGMATLPVQNGTPSSTLTLFGGLAVDPVTNQAFVVKSGSGSIDIVDLTGGTAIKPTHISEVIVPSPPNSGQGSIGGITNALVPQAALTCTVPVPPATSCDLANVRILGSGFASGMTVRLDSTDITTIGGSVATPVNGGREVDVTIPALELKAPHHFALDVLSNGFQSNAADFIVVQQVDLSAVCTNSGAAVNTMPSSVALADQIANGPLSPFALVSVTGCNDIVKIDLNPASATFGQQIGKPIQVGTNPEGIAIWQHKGLAVVANNGDGTASVIDLTQNPPAAPQLCASSSSSTTLVACAPVSTGTNPTGAAINEATGAAIVTNNGSNTVTMLNLAQLFPPSGTNPPTSLTPVSIGGIQQPIAVAIDPDRGTNNQGIAVVTSVQITSGSAPFGALSVVEIGTATPALSTIFSPGFVSSIPTGIVFDPAVNIASASSGIVPGAFFANSSGTNSITVFIPEGGGGSVAVGVNPTSLAINPQTGAMLTANSASNTISIVDTISRPFKTHQTLGIPGSPTFGVAIDQFTNLAVIVDQANMRVLLFPMPN